MPKQPPIHELKFLKYVPNHGELGRKLSELQLAAPDLAEYARHVAKCWYRLAESHLDDAQKARAVNCERATFSRAYYAAYNASKAIRYLVNGAVSLKADDHQKAPELPDDFPTPDVWSEKITKLYENRLLADYDNWSTTASEHSMTQDQALNAARDLLHETRNYLNSKYGMSL